jgi:HPt (histidine-containing phosphotransfer) domain-containing protein
VDLATLAELMGDDPAMFKFAFTEYLETTPPDLAELVDAVAAADHDRIWDCAHRLKGASNMIGAHTAGERAYELERRAFAGDLAGDDTLPGVVAREIELVLEFIQEWLANQGAEDMEAS